MDVLQILAIAGLVLLWLFSLVMAYKSGLEYGVDSTLKRYEWHPLFIKVMADTARKHRREKRK